MMKKEYIAPAIEVVEMDEICIVAGSLEDGGTIGGNFNEEADEVLSNRRRNYWKEVGGGWEASFYTLYITIGCVA